MSDSLQKTLRMKRFSTIEASFRIEGLDPSGDAIYEAAKAMVLAGEMSPQQALAYVVEQSAAQRRQLSASA